MDTEIYKAILEMIKTGGSYTVYGVIAWGVLGLLKISIIGSIMFLIIKTVFTHLSNIYLIRLHHKGATISLLSKSVSAELKRILSDYQKESQALSQELLKHVEDLKKESKEVKKKSTIS